MTAAAAAAVGSLEHVVGISWDSVMTLPETWDWAGLAAPSAFVWRSETVPLAHPTAIAATWVVYLGTVFGLKAVVGSRWPVCSVAVVHNAGLCLVSFAMLGVLAVWMASQVASGHWQRVFCWQGMPGDAYHVDVSPGWLGINDSVVVWTITVYYYTKWWELLDTVLLAVTRKPLIFLHVYHHCVVILLVWMWLQGGSVLAFGLGAGFNTFVHTWMYWYYMQRALGNQVWFKRHITSLQIIQFLSSFALALPFVGLTRGYLTLNPASFPDPDPIDAVAQLRGSPPGHACSGWYAFLFSTLINASFLALFISFFARTYGNRRKKTKKQS